MSTSNGSLSGYALVSTALGWVGILASPVGIRRLTLPQPSPLAALTRLRPGEGDEGPEQEIRHLPGLGRRLAMYFAGQRVDFPYALDVEGTPFQKEVWTAVRAIPYGETRSYTWVAHQVGRPGAARAVGGALRANPVSIVVPCHRVIGSEGNLCGFGGPQGLPLKRVLLDLECGNGTR